VNTRGEGGGRGANLAGKEMLVHVLGVVVVLSVVFGWLGRTSLGVLEQPIAHNIHVDISQRGTGSARRVRRVLLRYRRGRAEGNGPLDALTPHDRKNTVTADEHAAASGFDVTSKVVFGCRKDRA